MAAVLTRLAAGSARGVLEAGRGGWLADAGGGWTLLAAHPVAGAEPEQDAAAYDLAARVRDLDPGTPALLLWTADPDSGYLLQRGAEADSHVWGVPNPDAPAGDPRAVAQALGRRDLEPDLAALLQRSGPPADCVHALTRLVGADPDRVGEALAGRVPAGSREVTAAGCCQAGAARPEPRRPAVAPRIRRTLGVLAAVFALVVVSGAVVLAAGAGSGVAPIAAIVVFSVLAVLCLAVSVGLGRVPR